MHYGVYARSRGSAGWGLYCQSVDNANGCGGNRAWNNASDLRLKTDITALSADMGLEGIMQLKPVTYRWKGSGPEGKIELGFIAQDMQGVYPQVVGKGPDQEIELEDGTKETVKDTLVMSYGQMVVPIVKAVQELKTENDGLKAENADLRARIERLEAAIAER